jgi:hypothetical protein
MTDAHPDLVFLSASFYEAKLFHFKNQVMKTPGRVGATASNIFKEMSFYGTWLSMMTFFLPTPNLFTNSLS